MSGWRRYVRRIRKTVRRTTSSARSTLNRTMNEALKQAQRARRQFNRYIPDPRRKLYQLKKWTPLLKELATLRRKLGRSRTTTRELTYLLKRILPRKYSGTASLRRARAHREIESFLRRKGINLDNIKRLIRKVGITGDYTYIVGVTGELKSITGVDAGAGLAIQLSSRYPKYGWYVFGSGAIGGVAEATVGIQEGVYFRPIIGMPGPYMAIEASAVISGVGLIGGEVSGIFDYRGLSGAIVGYTPGVGGGINGALGVLVAQPV
ncbi:MAG: hypothetical protein JSV34_04585 [Candidatus Omnitrophota bacterium]|nr:MAG: hypothetical protein JSV34_04585 [Candidatus Omnitrophota bacterium]